MDVLIINGYVLDPANDRSGYMNVLIRDDSILEVGENVKGNPDKVIDADGCYVMPGLIDMHVHLREPGYTHKETIRTGARAAAKGGFTTICAMPNTKPVTDNPYTVSDIIRQADKEALIHVLVVGAMTREQQGERVADMEGMFDEGIIAVSEDGSSVKNAAVCLEAMKEAARLGLPVLDHCEDEDLAGDGVFNEGTASKKFGVKGIPNCAEDTVAARDIVLAKAAGCDLHLCHVSTKESTLLVYLAKAAGSHVTCEVTPHHFTLCDEDIDSADTNFKMNPPLRSREDREALREGLREGTIDVIATDHAPHTYEEKDCAPEDAPFGIVGLETALPLTWTELVVGGYLTPEQMVEKMSVSPAKILGIKRGSLSEGAKADITVFDPRPEYTIDKNSFVSMGRNTPFHGRRVMGRVKATIVNGRPVYMDI